MVAQQPVGTRSYLFQAASRRGVREGPKCFPSWRASNPSSATIFFKDLFVLMIRVFVCLLLCHQISCGLSSVGVILTSSKILLGSYSSRPCCSSSSCHLSFTPLFPFVLLPIVICPFFICFLCVACSRLLKHTANCRASDFLFPKT